MQPPHERPDLSRLTPLIVGAAAAIVAIILLWVVTSVRRDQPFPVDVWWHDLMDAEPDGCRTRPGLDPRPPRRAGLAHLHRAAIVATLLILRWWWAAITVAAALVLCIAIAAPLARSWPGSARRTRSPKSSPRHSRRGTSRSRPPS